jgi:DNA topoisomerase-1
MKNLVIVESPAKAKTIEKYLGSDYQVVSSMGHIRALPSKGGSIDVANNFAPIFEVTDDKKKTVSQLKAQVKQADTVWLASDEDREGEAIAWHLSEVLGLKPASTKRIVFHEITKSALEEAVAHPRSIDQSLVEAQQARQALDYLVGFELSPVLWRKVRPQLSAGRVQSVAVRLIVDRERELEEFAMESWLKLKVTFTLADGSQLVAESPAKHTLQSAAVALESFILSIFTVGAVTKKPGTRSPAAPFTTSTLQQEASNRLGYSPRSTMQLAQRLYEAGHITYMRTDSVNLSNMALGAMTNYIKQQFGDTYHQFRTYKTKSAGAQEAHEAIRPTHIEVSSVGADEQQKKLYNLIWRRTLASQMAPAQLEKTTITITGSHSKEKLEATGEVVIFDGFLKVYGRSGDDTLLPPVTVGDVVSLAQAEALETLSRGPARYTEASLVRKLEEAGIGRPSTYASTISTIQARGYVERGDIAGEERQLQKLTLKNNQISQTVETFVYGKDTNKLIPTDTGMVVTDFLVKHFSAVMDYDFTKTIEEQLDEIAEGSKDRVTVLRHFYEPFHALVEKSVDISRAEATQTRQLGTDPKSEQPIFARYGRFGPMLQKGEQSDDPKPQFAPLPVGSTINDVTLEQALTMFTLPRLVGESSDGQPIKANIGRFGPYVQVGKVFVSIAPLDPFSITLEEALQLYADKLQKEAEKNIADFGDIKVLNGRFGPYVSDGTKNAKIAKGTDPKTITQAQAKELLASAPTGKGRFRRRVATKSTSKTPAKKVTKKTLNKPTVKTTAKKVVKKTTVKKPTTKKPSLK